MRCSPPSRGADVTGTDVAPKAIGHAREKAAERGLLARFEVTDVLDLEQLGLSFDTVIDSGVFRVFDDEDRARYVASIAAVLRPGGACYLMCFSDRQRGNWGPRRVRADELRAAFSDGWPSSQSPRTPSISTRSRALRRWPRGSPRSGADNRLPSQAMTQITKKTITRSTSWSLPPMMYTYQARPPVGQARTRS